MFKKPVKSLVAYTTLAATSAFLARPVSADQSVFDPSTNEAVGQGGGVNFDLGGFGFSTLSQAINTILSVIFFGSALAAFIFIVIGAFQYVTAGDDAAKTEKSRKTITNAVVGLILVALVYVIFQIVIRIVPGLSQWFSPAASQG